MSNVSGFSNQFVSKLRTIRTKIQQHFLSPTTHKVLFFSANSKEMPAKKKLIRIQRGPLYFLRERSKRCCCKQRSVIGFHFCLVGTLRRADKSLETVSLFVVWPQRQLCGFIFKWFSLESTFPLGFPLHLLNIHQKPIHETLISQHKSQITSHTIVTRRASSFQDITYRTERMKPFLDFFWVKTVQLEK